jgi:hypothetical protein
MRSKDRRPGPVGRTILRRMPPPGKSVGSAICFRDFSGATTGREPCGSRPVFNHLSCTKRVVHSTSRVLWTQDAQQAVLLLVDASGEPERIGAAGRRRAGQQAPQARLGERLAGGLDADLAGDMVGEMLAVPGKDVDPAVPEVSD